MGIIFSKWRKTKTTIEVLEEIDKKILQFEKFRRSNEERRSQVITRFIIYSVLFYLLLCICVYLLFTPENTLEYVLQSLPLVLFPVVIFFLKRCLQWWFVRKLAKNDKLLKEHRDQRKEILENVMETETYKRAKEILEKFDPETKKKLEQEAKARQDAALLAQHNRENPGQELRRRGGGPGPSPPRARSVSPGRMPVPGTPAVNGMPPGRNVPATPHAGIPPNLPATLPRPILRQNRSTMEKFVEYLVGEGPNNRYALICQNCRSHNGMALREEFEFIDFRCAYCGFYNPPRKQRPNRPLFPPRPPVLPRRPASASEIEGKPAPLVGTEQDSGNESVQLSSDSSTTTNSRDINEVPLEEEKGEEEEEHAAPAPSVEDEGSVKETEEDDEGMKEEDTQDELGHSSDEDDDFVITPKSGEEVETDE